MGEGFRFFGAQRGRWQEAGGGCGLGGGVECVQKRTGGIDQARRLSSFASTAGHKMHKHNAERSLWWGWSEDKDSRSLIAVEERWRERLAQEPWSMIVAIHAAAQHNARLEQFVLDAFSEVVEQMDQEHVSHGSQWWSAIAELFASPCVESGLRWLRKTRLLSFLFPLPPTSVGWDLEQSANLYHHESVWEHTLSVIRCLQTLFEEMETPRITRLRLVLLAFFHDAGKTVPILGHQYKPDGGIRFVGHPKVSAEIAHHALTRLGVADALRHDIQRLVLLHDEVLEIREADLRVEPPSPKLLGLLRKLERRAEMLTDLALFAIADRQAHAPGHNDDRLMRQFYALAKQEFARWDQRLEPLLAPHEIQIFLSKPLIPPADHTSSHEELASASTTSTLTVLQEHLLWAQQHALLQTQEQARQHLRRLQHLAMCARTTLSNSVWLNALLVPLESVWPPLDQPIAFWVSDHAHQLRFPHPDPKEAPLLFPYLLHGHAIRSLAAQIAAEKGATEPPQGRWIKMILREVGVWQIEQGQHDTTSALQRAHQTLLQQWDRLFLRVEDTFVLK